MRAKNHTIFLKRAFFFAGILLVTACKMPEFNTGGNADETLLDGGTQDGNGSEDAGEDEYSIEGAYECLNYRLSMDKKSLTSGGFLIFDWEFLNNCNLATIIHGKIYLEVQNERGVKKSVPLAPVYSRAKNIAPGKTASAVEFGVELVIPKASEAYSELLNGDSLVVYGKFEGNISGGVVATNITTQPLSADLKPTEEEES